MKNYEKLKAEREAQRLAVQKYLGKLEESKSEGNMVQFDTVFKSLEIKVGLLNSLNQKILADTDVQNVQEEILSTDEYSLELEIQLGDLCSYRDKQNLRKENPPPIDSLSTHVPRERNSDGSLQTLSSVSSQFHRLPKLKLPTFDGDMLQWQAFWDSFETSVHLNNSLTDVQKFNYLKGQLEGDAARTLEGFALTNANYHRAVELLKDRFGQEQKIIHVTMQTLLNLPSPCNTISSMRHFCDKIEAYIRGLESLGKTQESYGTLLVPVIIDRLPAEVKRNLARINKHQNWQLDALREAINNEICIMEAGESGHIEDISTISFFAGARLHNDRNNERNSPIFMNRKKQRCPFCYGEHSASKCIKYRSVDDRLSVVKEKQLCYNCLGKHQVSKCRSTKRCQECKKKHHTSICWGSSSRHPFRQNQTVTSDTQSDTAVLHSAAYRQSSTVLLKTALATVRADNYSTDANILFDEGSQRSFIRRDLANKLNIHSRKHETHYLSSFGNHGNKVMTMDVADVHLVTDSNELITIKVLIVPTIATPMNNRIMKSVSDIQHLRGLKLAHSVKDCGDFTISMLIGADSYWKIVEDHIIRGNGPTAVKSKLGYLLSGPVNNDSQTCSHIMNVLTSRVPDVESLERFWRLESAGILSERADKTETEQLENYQMNSIEYVDGRYVAKLPWKPDCPELPTNKGIVLRRTEHTIRRLSREPEIFSKYGQIIAEQESKGFIKKVPTHEDVPQRVHYIPHHPVKKDSSTTPVRIVYDCSCRQSTDQPSLNDCLESTPPQLNDLTSLLVRFRLHKYAVTTDIEKAFLQVGLHIQDRDVTRFFWLSDPSNPESPFTTYRFRVVLFGATCSPFILNATLLKHLKQCGDSNIAHVIERDLYVDNVISSFDQSEQLMHYFYESREMLTAAGMNLRSWASNNKALRRHAADKEVLDRDDVTKVLGMRWDPSSDMMSFVTRNLPVLQTVTKRDILRYSSQIYDPMGLLSPVTVRAKLLMQDLWKEKFEWDVPLSASYQLRWNVLAQDLNQASDFKFQRHYFNTGPRSSPVPIQIHVFVDASMKSYGAVGYICRDEQSDLVMAKNRIAPLKNLTVPKLELMAAVVGSRLAAHLQAAIPTPSEVTLWSDSLIILHWITSTKTLARFVGSRVEEIHKLSLKSQWRYCSTVDNPADLLTRGISAEMFFKSNLWQKGPTWLVNRQAWPRHIGFESLSPSVDQATELCAVTSCSSDDIVGQNTHVTVNIRSATVKVQHGIGDVIEVERYSNHTRLVRVSAYVLRFIKNCRLPKRDRISGSLNASEIGGAKLEWVKTCQIEQYSNEMNQLLTKSVQSSLARQLRLFLDNKNYLRCGGRIHNAPLQEDSKFPYLLPNKHPYTRLLVKAVHEKQLHAGPAATITSLRESYWIPSIRQCVRSVLRKCVTCNKVTGQPYSIPDPPPLPKDRLQDSPPFQVTGVDFSGALYVRDPSGRESKAYVCLFTCASTRAVHLELVPDLTTESFLQAFRRFSSRRSLPKVMISDNATTYNTAANMFKHLFESREVKDTLSTDGIEWKFIPKRAPWYGGWWERLIGLTKQTLKKILGRSFVSFLTLQTILTEIEAVMNDRPLTYVASAVSDAEALTPSHLLYGRRITTLPDTEIAVDTFVDDTIGNQATLRKRARVQRTLIDNFRERWRREYLTALREHHRVTGKNNQTVAVGDVVQVHDDSPRCRWKLAVIKELVTGRDGFSRSAIIRTDRGLTNRPIAKLYPLEVIS